MSMTGLGLEWSRRKHPELRRKLQPTDQTATTTAAQPRPPHALPPLPKRVEPANASDAADADRGRSAAIAAAGSRTSTHALRTPRAADWGFSRHQRSMRRCRLVERPSPPPPRRRATPAQSLRESAAAQGVRASPWLHSPSCGSGSDTCGSAAEPRPQPWAGALGRLRGYVRWAFIFSANENSTTVRRI